MGTRGARTPSTIVCVALALTGFARGGAAEPARTAQVGLDLLWTAPASCPQQPEVRHRLVQQLRNPPPPDARAQVTITATAGDFNLTLQTRSRQVVGERKLSHPNCDELASAAIAMVAWTFDGDSGSNFSQAPEQALEANTETPAAPGSTSSPPALAVGAVGAVSSGQFGLVSPGVGISGRLLGANFSGRLLLAHWFAQTQMAPDGMSEGRVALWTSTLSGCFRASVHSSWDVCLLVEGGVVQARGAGQLEPARSATAPWFATGASASWLLFRESDFRVPLELAGLLPLRGSRFVLESANRDTRSDTLFQTSLELRLSVGIEVY